MREQLGTYTKIKVSTFPRDLLDPMAQRHGSLPGKPAMTYLGCDNIQICAS